MHVKKDGNYAFPNHSYPRSTVVVPPLGGAVIVASILGVVIPDATFTDGAMFTINHGAGAPLVLEITGVTVPFTLGFYGIQ